MADVKITITLDETTVARLQDTAERLGKPESEVIRNAIQDFHERIGQLSERERRRMLRAFDDLVPKIPMRSSKEVEREIEELRLARRTGGRTTAVKKQR